MFNNFSSFLFVNDTVIGQVGFAGLIEYLSCPITIVIGCHERLSRSRRFLPLKKNIKVLRLLLYNYLTVFLLPIFVIIAASELVS